MRLAGCAGGLALCLLLAGGRLTAAGAEAGPNLAEEEKLLKEAGVPTDGPGLLAYFRSRTLSAGDQEQLRAAVRRLGDHSFPTRERASRSLLAAGRLALPYLRPATADPDLEVRRRARLCVEEIERLPHAAVMTAAARVAAVRRPAGLPAALLACLPWVDDDAVQEAVFEVLAEVGLNAGAADPALVTAATDKDRTRRAAAAYALGRAGPLQRRQVARLLDDPDVTVRFHAANALVRAGDKAAVPVLVALLADAPVELAWQAEDVLARLADQKGPAVSVAGDAAERRKCRAAWDAWWKANGPGVDLARLKWEEALLGLNVVCELDGAGRVGTGRVWECGRDGKLRWAIETVQRPIDAQWLPGGRVLVAEHGEGRPFIVTERDRTGKVLWQQRVDSQPVSCQRLPNGNTFIAGYGDLLEVTRDHKVVFSQKVPGMVYNAVKMRDGNMVYVSSNNQVVELDPRGKVLYTVPVSNTSGWASVERLGNGNYLVAVYSDGKVVEVDRSGKVLWQCAVAAPGHASRLRNGNTLVASIEGRKVIEFDRSGKEVWSQATGGRPFHVRRR